MGKIKGFIKYLQPKKLTFMIDRVGSPCYTVSITGGAVMNKNNIANANNQPKTSMVTAVKDISTTVNTAISESENTQREEFNALADIANNDAISPEDRTKVLDMMRESTEYHHKQKMVIIRNITISVITLVGLGIASGTAVKLYTIRRAI